VQVLPLVVPLPLELALIFLYLGHLTQYMGRLDLVFRRLLYTMLDLLGLI
jgi:hypothetical protein